MRKGAIICGLTAVLSACGAPETLPGWQISTDTLPDGTVHVVNSPPPGETPGWTLDETLRVGSVDGGDAATFGQIRGLVALDDGGFAVLDAIAQEVRVFGRDGVHVATHGGKGGGPGEFEAAFGLMKSPDGMLWVPDWRNARMSVLHPTEGLQWSAPLRIFSRGFIWRGAMTRAGQVWKPSITIEPPRRNVMRVYSSEMELMDSLPLLPDPDVDPEDPPSAFVWRSADGRSGASFGVPFYPHSQTLVDPAGAVWSVAYGDPTYRIRRWVPGGDTTLVLETRRAPLQVTESERDSAIAAVRDQLSQLGAADQDWSKIPSVHPAVAGMLATEDGDLWVRTAVAGSQVFDVYSADGVHLRTVANPLRLYRPLSPVVRGDEFWAVTTDELDVHYVTRATVVPIEGGS